MKVKRPGGGESLLSPELRRSLRMRPRTYQEIVAEQESGAEADSASRRGPPPAPRRKPRRSRWKRALALGLLPSGALGGYVAPLTSYVTTVAPAETFTSTATPAAAPAIQPVRGIYQAASGGEYLLSPHWQQLAASHGRAAAEDRAAAVVDVANRCAGGQALTPGLRRYLIQMVLSGVGGLNPDEASDIIELSVDVQSDPLLEPLIKVIADSLVTGAQTVQLPPDDGVPGASGVLRYADFELGQLLSPWPDRPVEPPVSPT